MARFATFTVGSQVIVLPKGLQVHLPERAREQLHRHARPRQAQEAAHRPVGAVHRRGVPPPRLPRHRRHAADAPRSTTQFMADTDAEQAREAGRRAARPQGVRRAVGDEVGRAAADPLVATRSATRRCCSTTTGCRTRSPATCRSNEMVQELLGANGGTFKNPATNYYQNETDTLKVAENVAQVFMGMRIQCAQCHNHPFDRWTMDDYYGFAAFFAQIGRKGTDDPREIDRLQHRRRRGEPPGRRPGDEAEVPRRRRRRTSTGKDRREVLAEVAGVAGEPVLRHQPGQHRLGPLLRPRHHRRGRRRPHQQPGRRTRSCSTSWARSSPSTSTTSRSWSATSARRGPTSSRRSRTPANAGDTRNFARARRPPHPGRDVARLHHAR